MKTSITIIVTLAAWPVFCMSATEATSPARVEKASIHQKTKSFQVDVDYPQLKGLPHAAEIDAEILRLVKQHIADFNKLSGESEPSSFTGRFNIASATPDIVSCRFTFENRNTPGGRPLETFEDFNYCPKSSKKVSLDDIFSESVKYEELLSVLSLNELITKEEPALTEQATDANKENYDDFTISAAGLDIHFGGKESAESSAGAMDEHTVHIPWAAIKDLMSPASPLYQVALSAGSQSDQPAFQRDKLHEQIATSAVGAYSRLIDKSPNNSWAYRKRAEWQKNRGQTALAEADLTKADELDGRKPTLAIGSSTSTVDAQATSTAQVPAQSNSKNPWGFCAALILVVLGAVTIWSRRRKEREAGDKNKSSDRS